MYRSAADKGPHATNVSASDAADAVTNFDAALGVFLVEYLSRRTIRTALEQWRVQRLVVKFALPRFTWDAKTPRHATAKLFGTQISSTERCCTFRTREPFLHHFKVFTIRVLAIGHGGGICVGVARALTPANRESQLAAMATGMLGSKVHGFALHHRGIMSAESEKWHNKSAPLHDGGVGNTFSFGEGDVISITLPATAGSDCHNLRFVRQAQRNTSGNSAASAAASASASLKTMMSLAQQSFVRRLSSAPTTEQLWPAVTVLNALVEIEGNALQR